MTRRRRTRKRLAIGIAVPAVLLFLGILFALLLPYNFFVICEALDSLGLLGGRTRVEGLAARPPGAAPAPPLHIVNGLLWDAQHGRRPNPGLAIDAGRIVEAPVPGARRIDASGMTILPGFIDMHVHSYGGTFEGEMLLGSGVTTARDLGTQLAGALRHRQEAAEGRRLSPRLIVTGPYLVAGETTSDQEEGVAGPADAARAVARFAAAGVDGIKVHRGVDVETMKAV
ncbi:MAG TPA: hypothetical protein VFP98_08400, partial [Candidatus Polarisedimenticolia bacterium]|nr:hypothetical protein [Candidatus Polarisedimenticolia bacterium]